MLYSFVRFMIRWRVAVLIAAALWAILGAWIAWRTPIDALPDLSDNQVLIYTPWANHDPPEIDSQITQPLSTALSQIEGMQTLRGSSDVGFSLMHCIFEDRVSFQEARQRVLRAMNSMQVLLPSGVTPQLAPEGIPTGQIVWYTLSGNGIDLLELRRWQDEFVVPRLQQVAGVAEVASVGGMQPEIRIQADPSSLAAATISIGQLAQQLELIPAELLQPPALNAGTQAWSERVKELGDYLVASPDGSFKRLDELCRVELQPAPRQGVFEQDGNELVAGIVHLQVGENPLQVTRRVLERLRTLGDELPEHLRLRPCYNRSPLIQGAVRTLLQTLIEAIVVTVVGIWLIMRHLRASLVIVLTVPLSVFGAFIGMSILTEAGSVLNINIMSLAGIAISIGVLIDSSIVIVDNIQHHLRKQFGDQPFAGDTSHIVAQATAVVAQPAVFAILIMLVSFLPIFVLQGIDGKMYRPLAWTKTLTLLSIVVLAVTVVPAMASFLIRGRIRHENESSIVRMVARVYRPCLNYLFERPWPLVLMLGCVIVPAAAALGSDWMLRLATLAAIACVWLATPRGFVSLVCSLVLLLLGLALHSSVKPIQLALRLPLNEGMVMDMPITIPRMNAAQAGDDLKARNMILCRFPEVKMVTGKAGRADTAFDPAPMDMIETMVEFRSRDYWPRRRLMKEPARRHALAVLREMTQAGLIESIPKEDALVDEVVDAGLKHFDAIQRELCWQELQPFEKRLSEELCLETAREVARYWLEHQNIDAPWSDLQLRQWISQLDRSDLLRFGQQPDANSLSIVVRQLCRIASKELGVKRALESVHAYYSDALVAHLQSIARRRWKEFIAAENQLLYNRAGRTWTWIVVSQVCERCPLLDAEFADTWDQVLAARYSGARLAAQHHAGGHVGMPSYSKLPIITPHPKFDALVTKLSIQFARQVWLWPHDDESLAGPVGELDAAVQMPGWANVWTRPIQNRIDMLATGVTSEVGVRVLGSDLLSVLNASEQIAEILQGINGSANVLCDPVRDKDYIDAILDFKSIETLGLNHRELELAVETVTRGRLIGVDADNASWSKVHKIPLRLMVQPEEAGRDLLRVSVPLSVAATDSDRDQRVEPHVLSELATLQHRDGPATIKSENGRLRNYVRLNVRDRNIDDWIAEAKQTIEKASLPSGISLEWTGQFEHAARTRTAMLAIIPVCVLIIGLLLFFVFRDWADALLMLLSVPGALAGAVLCQWLLGFPFSLAVGVGYIACFGMAAATSMVMLVYLRQALADAGGLESLTLDELKATVIQGAVHRLRPKLLTETAMILGLAPMMWSIGVGADVIRPMAAPVLGGILIADEVVDLLIPVLFYAVRKRRWLNKRSSNPTPFKP